MPSVQRPAPADDISIIVVDDARVTCEIIRRVLAGAGFEDIRVASSAEQALAMMRERAANILIADWLMPRMDGLSLTRHVRQFDEERNHYTYIILLTAKEGVESLAEAFKHGVDDFINKSPNNQELLARINAAGRISDLQNDLLAANRKLRELNRQLEERHSFDAVTGLGNRIYLEHKLDNLLRHIEARGGGICFGLVRLNGFELLRRRHGEAVSAQLIEAGAARLQQTMRPLDVIGRVEGHVFGVLMHQEDGRRCHPNAFRRLHQALSLRAYKTEVGFLTVGAAIAICNVKAGSDRRPVPAEVIDYMSTHLDAAQAAGRVHLVEWPG
jgi:phosphoserine phosphatase RsbU/P